ncbi:MAG: DUF302 domain-containing protein [Marinibacterium sp.]
MPRSRRCAGSLQRIALCLILAAGPGNPLIAGGDMAPRPGFEVYPTTLGYDALVDSVRKAVRAEGLIVVTQAGPTAAAAKRGIDIPGNRVIGVFNNDFAVRVLETSTAAMIEAPIRMYVTENHDGTATLSYKRPSHVLAPYADEGGAKLMALGAELDARFADIAAAVLAGSQ